MNEHHSLFPSTEAGGTVNSQVMARPGRNLLERLQHFHLGNAKPQAVLERQLSRKYHDYLQFVPVRRRHPGNERPVHRLGAEVLVFQINDSLGSHYRVVKQFPYLQQRYIGPLQVSCHCLAESHLAGGNRDRPGCLERECRRSRGGGFEVERAAARIPPALPEQFRQFLDDRAGVVGLDVVVRIIARAVAVDTVRVLQQVPAVIPAVGADIDATHEGDCSVDNHEFLMVGGTHRMTVIEPEVDPLVGRPVEDPLLKPFPLQ